MASGDRDECGLMHEMPSENPFHVAVVVLLVLTTAVGGYHRLQAAKSGERISHKEEGYIFAISLRLAGLCLWVATFGYLLYPAAFQWAAVPLAEWTRWVGFVTGILGVFLMYWTLSNLGKNLTDTVVTRREATLVTHGPYRWVRHPLYATAAVLMTSVTVLTANWLIGLTSLIVLVLLAIRTPKEEEMLVKRFGDQYLSYMATTGRFIPRLYR
jgi:protein-S-isoprenylcysteine O-methyltransferase Ste14